MDREDGVELFNDYRVDLAAFPALSRCAADQPVGYLIDARDIFAAPRIGARRLRATFLMRHWPEQSHTRNHHAANARWRRESAASMRSENRTRCDEGCRLSIPYAKCVLALRADVIRYQKSGEAGPIQRIAARTIDAYELEFTRRCNYEADQLPRAGRGTGATLLCM